MFLNIASASEAEVVLSEIVQLSSRVVTLKRRFNSLQPVSRLPAELVLEVFSLIVYEWASTIQWDIQQLDEDQDEVDVPSYTWLPAVTHVCHIWRELALKSPCLWRWAILSDPSSLKTVLERSKAVPISGFYYIEFFQGEEKMQQECRRLLAPELHRIKSAQIVSADPSHKDHRTLFSGLLLSIEMITLFMLKDETTPQDHADCHVAPFKEWIPEDHHRLLSLSLARISLVGIQAAIRPSLRNLSLHTLPSSVTMKALLAILKSTPLLESLTLLNTDLPLPPKIQGHVDQPDWDFTAKD